MAAWLEDRAAFPDIRGPLGALWRLGGDDLARLCGVALGAGEAGLALVCDGPAGIAAAGLAVAVQPALAPRVRRGLGVLAGAARGARDVGRDAARARAAIRRRARPRRRGGGAP